MRMLYIIRMLYINKTENVHINVTMNRVFTNIVAVEKQ